MIYLSGFVGFLLVLTAEARVGNSSELNFCTETEECLLFDLICRTDDYEEPTQADAPPQTDSDSASHPEKEPKTPSNAPFSPSLALLRLLQTAFNRQTPSSSSSSSSSWRKQQQQQQAGRSFPPPATRLPPQTLYQALDVINRFRGPEDNVYSDYSDGFYREKPYRHRDDRLLQALFEMIDGDHK